MTAININVSGACGSGSSFKIYETPEYDYTRRGACVMHGSFTTGPTSPNDQRIEVVELYLPGFSLRVRAADVRPELRVLLSADKAWQAANWSAELNVPRHQAFAALLVVVFCVASRGITVEHFEQITRAAYEDGQRHGEEAMREQFRTLLGL